LIEVRRAVLDHLDGNHLLRLQVLALDDLAEGALAENVENQVAIPAAEQLAGENIEQGELRTYLCPASSEPRMSLT
jgi:hypothetical protein